MDFSLWQFPPCDLLLRTTADFSEEIPAEGGLRHADGDLWREVRQHGNFRGFPRIPGQDAVLRYATKDGGHEGSVL